MFCLNSVETEEHVLLSCSLYDDLREHLFINISTHVNNFYGLNNDDKVSVILGSDDINVIKISAKTCCDILNRRRGYLYR